jgi:hypothetical protein
VLQGVQGADPSQQDALHQRYPGLHLAVDLEKIGNENRERAVTDLQMAIEAIRSQA